MEKIILQEEQIVHIIVIAMAIVVLMAVAIIVFFYFSRKKIIQTELEKAELEITYQQNVIQSIIITQEEERKRIAQDLHDAISSKLNIVSLNANLLTEKDISTEETNKIGDSILKITNTVLESSRQIAHDLLPPTLDKFGLAAALEELCDEVRATQKFKMTCRLSYQNGFFPAEKELHIFRIVQELINNSIKHANATTLALAVETEENLVSLHYSDDGKGFDVQLAKEAKGLGMSGITNRAGILDGKFHITTQPQQGIKVVLEVNK